MKKSTTYRLGTLSNGFLYFFTGLGEFRTVTAANAKLASQPRNGTNFVIKVTDLGWGTNFDVLEP